MTVEENRKLIERYPFLLPRNYINDQVENGYDYSWTELDSLPDGWRIAFGSDMLEELREILIKGDYLDEYRILQIKEKFGALRWYDNSFPSKIADEMRAWRWKYEKQSAFTCIECGKSATHITLDYTLPLCTECALKKSDNLSNCTTPEEYYSHMTDEIYNPLHST